MFQFISRILGLGGNNKIVRYAGESGRGRREEHEGLFTALAMALETKRPLDLTPFINGKPSIGSMAKLAKSIYNWRYKNRSKAARVRIVGNEVFVFSVAGAVNKTQKANIPASKSNSKYMRGAIDYESLRADIPAMIDTGKKRDIGFYLNRPCSNKELRKVKSAAYAWGRRSGVKFKWISDYFCVSSK